VFGGIVFLKLGLLLIALFYDYFRIKVTRVIRQHRSK
jgi:hypothetical protein